MKNSYLLISLILILQTPLFEFQQKISPCPKVFTYDLSNDSADTWYGTLKLTTNVALHGISIDVIFDRRVPVFGAYYFNDVTTRNNVEYHIENKNYDFDPSETLLINFYVKYNQYESNIPLLQQIRLNGQNICVDLPRLATRTTKKRVDRNEGSIYPESNDRKKDDTYNTGGSVHSVQPIRPAIYTEETTTRRNARDEGNPQFTSSSQNSRDGNNYYNDDSVYYESDRDRGRNGNSGSLSPSGNSNSNNQGNQRPSGTSINDRDREYERREPEKPATTRRPITSFNSNRDDERRVTNNPNNQNNNFNTNRDDDRRISGNQNNQNNNFNKNPGTNSVTSRPSTTTTSRSFNNDDYYTKPTKNYYDDQTSRPTTNYGNNDYDRRVTRNQRTTQTPKYFSGDLPFLNGESTTHSILSNDREEDCGVIVPKSNPLIILGEETYNGQFPWHTALYLSSPGQLKYICGGSLVKLNLVITAAHCVTHQSTKRPINTENLLIYAGKFNLRKWTGPEQDGKVQEIIVHPDYDYERFFSDIAILKLKDNMSRSNYVRPVCLWKFDSDLKLIVEKLGSVPGFGYNERGLVSEDLSYIQMPVVTHEKCIWSNRDFFSKITSDKSFCAGFRNGTSVCNGDSGGGMVFKQGSKFYLRGIVSVSLALQNTLTCDPNHFAVFADVAKFVDWIKNYFY